MIRNEENRENSILPFFIKPLAEDRGQTICRNLIANLFEKGDSTYKREIPEVKIKSQLLDHYLKRTCNITQQNGIYTIEISSPITFHGRYLIQIDDVDIEFSKVFTEYIKNIRHQNSQRANSIFTDDLISIINSYVSILERTESQHFDIQL